MTTVLGTRTRALVDWLLKKHHVVSLFLLVVFFAPLLWLARYNYPSGDDYLAFFQAQNLGPFGATRWWYRHWTGRYSSFFLQSLFPEHSRWLVAYRVIPIILLLTGFFCLFCFVRALFGPNFPTKKLFSLSASAYVLLVSLTPEIVTAVYWLPTNVQYLGAIFTTLLLLSLYLNLGRAHTPLRRGLCWLAAILLMVFLAGLNEISILLFVAILIAVNVVHVLRFATLSRTGLVFLVCSVLFALLSFLAPGNSIRGEYIAAREASLTKVSVRAAHFTLDLAATLLTSTPLLLASALYFVFLERNRHRLTHLVALLAKVHWHWLLLFLLAMFTLGTAALFAATGMNPVPDRVMNVFVYSLVLSWFMLVTVLFVDLTSAGLTFSTQHTVIRVLSFAGAAVVIVYLATGFDVTFNRSDAISAANPLRRMASTIKTRSVYANAYLDIASGRAASYAEQNVGTTRRFRAANGQCVEFPPLSYAPETILVPFVKYPWMWCPQEFVRAFEGRHMKK
jgi:hypothetical protein